MSEAQLAVVEYAANAAQARCRVAVIWIDWYAYHLARLRGILQQPELAGRVVGIEMVGGIGVHAGLRFRAEIPSDLPVRTLLPEASWQSAGQLLLARRLWALLNELKPEMVLVPGYYTLPALAAALWARMHGRKSVLMAESTQEDHHRRPLREWAKAALIRMLFGWAIVGGKRHREYLRALGFRAGRIFSFYDVVDNDAFAAARGAASAMHQHAEGPRRFLYVGRLAPEKNIGGLLEAFFRYREEGGDWSLLLVGDGPEKASLAAQCAASPAGHAVQFAGHKSAAELPPYYAAASCFVLPSMREPWGLVVNEAMASGLPVVVSRRCGCADDLLADGENGFGFDPTDPDALPRALRAVATRNDAERAEMSARSQQIIAAYSPHALGRQVVAITNS